jgi:hypothetical protein
MTENYCIIITATIIMHKHEDNYTPRVRWLITWYKPLGIIPANGYKLNYANTVTSECKHPILWNQSRSVHVHDKMMTMAWYLEHDHYSSNKISFAKKNRK